MVIYNFEKEKRLLRSLTYFIRLSRDTWCKYGVTHSLTGNYDFFRIFEIVLKTFYVLFFVIVVVYELLRSFLKRM
jgi:hypothetical protein